ncbi:MAG TPA: acyl-CoA dehydrogenase [Steroidobacteraceae bacterium]|nr:acyl-CoA dehydrogenase [Steroidobacteraceae bacterium]
MYRAPLREVRFALHELTRDDRLHGLPGLAEYSAEFADEVLEQSAHFAEQVLAPINVAGDRAGAQWTPGGVVMPAAFKEAYRQFADAGWTRLGGSVAHGGLGAPTVLCTAVEEFWSSANLAFNLCPMLTRAAAEAIERCGSAEQRSRFVARMISGEWTGTMNLTEPQAGTDLGAIRTRAVPHGAAYRIFGQKIFITYGDHDYTPNIIHLVLARIDGAPLGTKGISLFIVPKVLIGDDGSLGARNDLRCLSIEHKLGIRASPTCVLSYGEADGATGYLVGEPNRGLEYMFIMMNTARLAVGLEGYAIGERAYQQALDWARQRVQGRPAGTAPTGEGTPATIVEHADVKRMLMTIKAETDAARAIALDGALQLDLAAHARDAGERRTAGARADLLIPIIKAWSTEGGIRSASLGIQVHGGMGFIEETGAAQYLRDVRITTIYEGTSGVQAADLVGRKIGRDAGAAMFAFLDHAAAEIASLQTADPQALRSRVAAGAAIGTLREATATLLRVASQGAERALAVAVPYLNLCGTVLGAWKMAGAHALAARSLAADPAFYAGKCQQACFYRDQILPRSAALAAIVAEGSASVADADASLF